MNFTALLNAMPGAIAQGLIWGIMAIGVYITYKVLDLADLTVDGTMATGGAVCVMLMLNGVNVWLALLCAVLAGSLLCSVLVSRLLCNVLTGRLLCSRQAVLLFCILSFLHLIFSILYCFYSSFSFFSLTFTAVGLFRIFRTTANLFPGYEITCSLGII